MGNDLTKEEDIVKEENVQNENIRYGLLSRKGGEKSNDDDYIISPNKIIQEGDTCIEYSLFGIFDGHNNNYISKYLSENINKYFEKEIKEINQDNYISKIETIFKEIDKVLRNEQNKNKYNENDILGEEDVNNSEKILIKNSIKNFEYISEDFKEIDDNDNEIDNFLAFKNLFDYKNNFLNSKNNLNYIGSSASIVLINKEDIFTIELGITKCFLFDKKGKILNSKIKSKDKNDTNVKENIENKNEHTFNNDKEKKRIKKFNKSIDYEALKMNPYLPTSRSFGFFKYKENELLKEENQIISCIPDIEKYNKNKVDYILLFTGLAINSEIQKLFTKTIKNINKNEKVKYTKIIEELLKNPKIKSKKTNDIIKNETGKNHLNFFFGNNDFQEENIILKELDEDFYRDVIELNETQNKNEHGNVTCILIKINKDKNEIQEENKIKEKNKEENDNKPSEDKSDSQNIDKKKENENNPDKNVNEIKENEKKEEDKKDANDDNDENLK